MKRDLPSPAKHAEAVDELVNAILISVARDVASGHYAGRSEDEIVKGAPARYAGLYMPTGYIDNVKKPYAELHSKHQAIADEEARLETRSSKEHRRTWLYRALTAATVAVVAVVTALIAKWLGISLPIKGL